MTTVWLTARGAGLAALVLLTLSSSLGAVASGRGTATTRVVVQHLHRVLATLGLGVLFVHIATIAVDTYAKVGVAGAVVPFTAGYRATWVGLGTIAAYAFVLVAALGAARGRLSASPAGVAGWRVLHVAGYAAWGLAMAHGLGSGTDTGLGWVHWIYIGCGATVGAALAVRLLAGRHRQQGRLVRAAGVLAR